MTHDDYKKATDLVKLIAILDENIAELQDILSTDTKFWHMDVRQGGTHVYHHINHMELLPEFLKMVLKAQMDERARLEQELSEL